MSVCAKEWSSSKRRTTESPLTLPASTNMAGAMPKSVDVGASGNVKHSAGAQTEGRGHTEGMHGFVIVQPEKVRVCSPKPLSFFGIRFSRGRGEGLDPPLTRSQLRQFLRPTTQSAFPSLIATRDSLATATAWARRSSSRKRATISTTRTPSSSSPIRALLFADSFSVPLISP